MERYPCHHLLLTRRVGARGRLWMRHTSQAKLFGVHFVLDLLIVLIYWGGAHTKALVWRRSGGSLEQLALSFYHVSPGNQTQVVRFARKFLYLLSHPTGSAFVWILESGSHFVAQAGLTLSSSWPLPSECWLQVYTPRLVCLCFLCLLVLYQGLPHPWLALNSQCHRE